LRTAERIRYLALAVQREGNRNLTAALRPLNLTPAQSEALRILGDHEPLSLGDLGRMLVCESGTNPSRLVDRLVRSGLVDRTEAADDRRQLSLTLTSRGRELEKSVRELEEQLYAELERSLAGVDVANLVGVLESLVAGRPSGEALAARIAAESGSR
jgi:DNA-binding MarR family transcriptional regulator